MTTGHFIIIAAPSGAGKTSLVKALVDVSPNLVISVSHTTRPSRPGEREGEDYHFIDGPAFEAMLAEDAFLEHATVYGHAYGTSRAWVEAERAAGRDVILEIDWQGARQIKQLVPDALSIYILPPSLAALEARLMARGQDDPAVVGKRLQEAKADISHCNDYDYIVVNDIFEETLEALVEIVAASRRGQRLEKPRHEQLVKNLLQT